METGAAKDDLVKKSLADFAAEHQEIASYEALIVAARARRLEHHPHLRGNPARRDDPPGVRHGPGSPALRRGFRGGLAGLMRTELVLAHACRRSRSATDLPP
jgi:hypothetical protein